MDNLARVCSLLADLLDVNQDEISVTTTREHLENWDSIQHLSIMMALEEEFDLRLDVDDLENLTSVAAILEFIESPSRPG
jgi:acyl carrier protein